MGTEFAGLLLVGIALLATLGVATYSPDDPVLALEPVANRAGAAGATIAGLLFRGVGWGAVVVVASLIVRPPGPFARTGRAGVAG